MDYRVKTFESNTLQDLQEDINSFMECMTFLEPPIIIYKVEPWLAAGHMGSYTDSHSHYAVITYRIK